METKFIVQSIFNLAPGAEFVFTDQDLTTLKWQSSEITQPSDAAIMAEAKRLANLPVTEPTVADKLASVGLSINDLKSALGL